MEDSRDGHKMAKYGQTATNPKRGFFVTVVVHSRSIQVSVEFSKDKLLWTCLDYGVFTLESFTGYFSQEII